MSKKEGPSNSEKDLERNIKELKKKIKNLKQDLKKIELEIKDVDSEQARSLLLDKLEGVRINLGKARGIISILVEFHQNQKLQWIPKKIKLENLDFRVQSLYRRIKDVVFPASVVAPTPVVTSLGGDPVDKDEKIKRGEYPHMGEYDTAKRFLLSKVADLSKVVSGFSYKEVKKFDLKQLVGAFQLFVHRYIVRELFGKTPYAPLDLFNITATVIPEGQPQARVSLETAVTSLGVETSQGLLDHINAKIYLFNKAHAHQGIREKGGAEEIVKTTTFSKGKLLNLLNPTVEGIGLQSSGVPMTDAALIRLTWSSVFNRGRSVDAEQRKARPSPLLQEDNERPSYNKAKKQMVTGIVSILKDKGATLPDKTLEQFATSVFYLGLNLSDTMLLRSVQDVGASRHDELDMSRLFRWRVSQEKYISSVKDKRGEGSRKGASVGNLEMDEAYVTFFESLYLPIMMRLRVRVFYLYKDQNDKIRVDTTERQFFDILKKAKDIREISPISEADVETIKGFNKELKKKQDEIYSIEKSGSGADVSEQEEVIKKTNEDLNDLLRKDRYKGLIDQIGTEDSTKSFRGGLVISSFRDLIDEHWPNEAEGLERKVIGHALKVRDTLKDFKFDLDSLVVKREREIGGGTYTTFNTVLADELRGTIRSAFYYWVMDYQVKKLSEREYDEFCKNYTPPNENDKDKFPVTPAGDEVYELAKEEYNREWRWRGIPLRIFKREEGGEIDDFEIDEKTKLPKIDYAEFNLNKLFNFNQEFDYRFTKNEIKWLDQDFKRVMGEPDQLTQVLKIFAEKIIMVKLKQFKASGKKWTHEHSTALIELMSSESFYKNIEGLRGLILGKKAGAYGRLKGEGQVYQGQGSWRRDEVINLIKSVIGPLKIFSAPPKEK